MHTIVAPVADIRYRRGRIRPSPIPEEGGDAQNGDEEKEREPSLPLRPAPGGVGERCGPLRYAALRSDVQWPHFFAWIGIVDRQ